MDNIQNRNVATVLGGVCHNHAVFRLQEPAHNIKNRGFPDSFRLVYDIAGKGGIGSHQEMTPGCWDQRSNDSNKIVVHVSGISKCSCAS